MHLQSCLISAGFIGLKELVNFFHKSSNALICYWIQCYNVDIILHNEIYWWSNGKYQKFCVYMYFLSLRMPKRTVLREHSISNYLRNLKMSQGLHPGVYTNKVMKSYCLNLHNLRKTPCQINIKLHPWYMCESGFLFFKSKSKFEPKLFEYVSTIQIRFWLVMGSSKQAKVKTWIQTPIHPI